MESFRNFLEPLYARLGNTLPGVLGGLLILLVGWIIAGVIRKLVAKGLRKADFDSRISRSGQRSIQIEKTISKFVYYIILIFVLMLALNVMGVESVLTPLQDLIGDFLGFIPNIIAAGIIGFAGYIIAKIASELVGTLTTSLEAASSKLGFKDSVSLGNILKQVVFVLVFIPILIVALDTLQMDAIAEPATDMLQSILNAIPNILAGALILVIFYVIARFVSPVVTSVLQNVGADQLPERMGMARAMGAEGSLSKLSGRIVFFFIMFFGIVSALNKVGLNEIANLLGDLLELSGQILFGLIIIAVGNFVANIAYRSLAESSDGGRTIATIVRYTVLGLFVAIALRTMGIANDIVNLAFGLTLGAAAVAIALSFGLGGREAAGKQMEYILKQFRKENPTDDTTPPPSAPNV